MTRLSRVPVVLSLVLAALLAAAPPAAEAQRQLHRRRIVNSYTTSFPVTANPIAEKGAWITGAKTGGSWQDVRVASLSGTQVAYGNQTGASANYDDSVAILAGSWAATQTVEATVYVAAQNSTAFQEVELWVRAQILPGSIKGYECAFRATSGSGNDYIGCVRWLGPFGTGGCGDGCAFESLAGGNCIGSGIVNGDRIKIAISSFTITTYINDVQQCQRTDANSTYPTGNPGMGLWYRINGAVGTAVTDQGLIFFRATAS